MGCASAIPVVIADPANPEELKPIATEDKDAVLKSALSTANVIVAATEVVAAEEEKPVAKPSTEVVAAEEEKPVAKPSTEAVAAMPAPASVAPDEAVAPEVVAPEVIAPAPAAAPHAPAISVLASYKEAFSVFDKDGSGTVSTSELGEIMSALGQNLSAEELDAIIKEVDADGSGEIDFDEFCACMQKAKEGGGTPPKLAVVVEENGLLSGLNNFFGRLFNHGPSAEENGAAEAAAKAAAEAEAARIATGVLAGSPPDRGSSNSPSF
ncbi:flagellar calmodulin [Chrysochromulina tobinii]|uniref:Flagellar calmodulin n=1 Tax=Chrysochromulina tobinii TaxID=1460289 RepID=A0A0M0K190_9EUKA|nr:flagellar calmodulin [Chrysochromulina tobinii]|eukprot:KOO32158.1 flagellar calmodulin [Chrysochromulina sp. CCMP291]